MLLRRLAAITLACLIGIQSAFGNVLLDAKATANTAATNATTVTNNNLTISSGTLLVAEIVFSGALPSGLTITWNGTSMTAVPGGSVSNSTNNSVAFFYLTSPATGNQSLVASWTGSHSDAKLCGESFTGANLTGGSTTFPSVVTNTGASANASVTGISTNAGDATIGVFAVNNAINSVTQTSLNFLDNSGIVTGGAADYSIAGTSTMSVSSNSGNWAAVGIEIVKAGAAAATPLRTLLGVGQ